MSSRMRAILTLVVSGLAASAEGDDATGPEARALAYLAREVPAWSREQHCFSCHNDGDAARALYAARRLGLVVPRDATEATSAWLAKPEGWEANGGEGPFNDRRLARLQFAAALAASVDAGRSADRPALIRAAGRLAEDQDAGGSWAIDSGAAAVGSPATYGRPMATAVARETLARADPARFRDSVDAAGRWLARLKVVTVPDAAAVLRTFAGTEGPEAEARRREAMAVLRAGQSADGGWGPYVDAPPEPFDTAIAVLALARCGDAEAASMLRRGRSSLLARQEPDGSWAETTRPAGGVSYAQKLSTTGWAMLALLASRGRG